jgi:hypothetical protein
MALYKLYSENGRFKVIRFSPLNTFEGLIENVTFELSNISTNTVKIIGLNDSGLFASPNFISDFEDVTGVAWEYEKLNRWIQVTKVGQKAQAVLELIASNISVDPYGVFSSTILQTALEQLSDAISVSGGVNIYNSDGTLTGNRLANLGGYTLSFDNGTFNIKGSNKIIFGDDTNLYIRKSGGSNGVDISAGGGGGGVKGNWIFGWNDGEIQATGNLGGESIRMLSSATDNYIGYRDASSSILWYAGKFSDNYKVKHSSTELLDIDKNTNVVTISQGILLNTPLTTVQISAIASPVKGMQVFNSNRNRIETYNGTYWQGEPMPYTVQSTSSSPVDAQTVYFGNMPKGVITTANISKVHIESSGVIRRANVYCYSGTAGTAENWSLYIRVNNTTDYLIETVGSATNERIFNNESLNIPVNAGDYFEIKAVNPTWVTNPLTTTFGGNVIVE